MYKNHKKTLHSNKGYTLIELIILILILAVISTIVIFSVSKARLKGQNSSIELALAPLYYQSQKLYDQRGTYGDWSYGDAASVPNCQVFVTNNAKTAFFFHPDVTNIIKLASQKSGGTMNGANITRTACRLNTNGTWAIAVTTKDGTGAYCLDTSGVLQLINKEKFKDINPNFMINNPNNPVEVIMNGGPGGKIRCQ